MPMSISRLPGFPTTCIAQPTAGRDCRPLLHSIPAHISPRTGGVLITSALMLVTLPLVTIGGLPAQVVFAGLVGPGLFQLKRRHSQLPHPRRDGWLHRSSCGGVDPWNHSAGEWADCGAASLGAVGRYDGRLTPISLEQIERASRTIDPVFLNSPQFESEPIGHALSMRFVLKVETINPIRNFKGRGADFFLAGLPADSPPLVSASAGNFGQGMAYAARKRGFPLTIFAAESANPLKVERMRQLGATVRLAGADFDEAKDHARDFARETGGLFVEDGRETPICEGAGSIAVELSRWADQFDFLFISLGNGALLAGIGHWMRAHSPQTKLIAVCAEGAPAMDLSLRSGEVRTTETVSTIADGIAVRVPVPESLDHLNGIASDIVRVDDDSMIAAMRLLYREHGLLVEPAGVAGLAAAMKFRERYCAATAGTILCGGNLTEEQIERWL